MIFEHFKMRRWQKNKSNVHPMTFTADGMRSLLGSRSGRKAGPGVERWQLPDDDHRANAFVLMLVGIMMFYVAESYY